MNDTEQEIQSFDDGARCPKCGSDNVSKPRVLLSGIVLAIISIGYPFPIPFKRRLCYECGNKFRLNK